MTFLFAPALWGLLLVPLLILLERWRRRPQRAVWPSLLLWRRIAEAEAPARRRVEPLLLYECLAVLLLSLAAAEPALRGGDAAREVVIVVDAGPHMQARLADGSTAAEATRREVDRIRSALADADRVVEFTTTGDPVRAIAAHAAADLRVLATNRPRAWGLGIVVVGRAPAGYNLGIDAVQVRGDKLWFAVATDGARRDVEVRAGTRRLTVKTGAGIEMPLVGEIEILTTDNYDGDDRVALRPLELRARDDTGSRRVRAALFEAGIRARPGDPPDLVVTQADGDPLPGVVRGSDCVASGLFDGLLLDQCAWRDVRARPGAGGILLYRERALAAWLDADQRTLWLGLPLDREWDEHGTLAVLLERAKRARVEAALAKDETLVGDAVAAPAPGLVETQGVDRVWSGDLPEARRRVAGERTLRVVLALLAAAVLALYVRAIVRA